MDHIKQQLFVGSGMKLPGRRCGRLGAGDNFAFEGMGAITEEEADDVGGLAMSQKATVDIEDRGIVDYGDGYVNASESFTFQHGADCLTQFFSIDWPGLVVGHMNDVSHFAEAHAVKWPSVGGTGK